MDMNRFSLYNLIFFFFAATGFASAAADQTDTIAATEHTYIKPLKSDYAFGLDEIAKSAALYRAVEEAASFKAMADAASQKSLSKAADNYLKALVKLKNFRFSQQYADMAFSLSEVYMKQKKYDDAANYLLKCSISYDTIGLKTVAGKTYIKLATIKLNQKKYKEAEALILKKGYPLCGPADNLACYNVLARTYKEQNRFSEAKWYYLQANSLSRKVQDTSNIINSLTELGRVKMAIKEYSLAMKDLDEAEELAQAEAYAKLLPEIKSAQQALQAKAPKLFAARVAAVRVEEKKYDAPLQASSVLASKSSSDK
jgi:tetratricopeptide (TPR) repeat protein